MNEEMKAVKKSNKKIVLTAAIVIVLAIVVIVVALKQMKARQLAEQLDLGVKYLSMMEYERAMDAYLDAIEMEPECVEAYFGLAAVYYETGEAEKAGAVLQQVGTDASRIFKYGRIPSDDGRGQMEIAGLVDTSLKVVVIPEKIEGLSVTIGEAAFKYCENMTYVIISDGVTEISDLAFGYCRSLTSITIPDSITKIGECAFNDCRSLTNVAIPESITEINDNVFAYCGSLTSVTIPDSVTKIGNGAFRDCESLTSIVIPDSVTKIGNGAFMGCKSLTSVTIPDSVTEIEQSAFSYCESLASVTIPDGVKELNYIFSECRSLKTIFTPRGSAAEQWAQGNGYEVVNTTP